MTEHNKAIDRGLLQVTNQYVQTWMGAEYSIDKPEKVGDLKLILQGIIDDLPANDELKISEVWCHQNKISVTLVEGILD